MPGGVRVAHGKITLVGLASHRCISSDQPFPSELRVSLSSIQSSHRLRLGSIHSGYRCRGVPEPNVRSGPGQLCFDGAGWFVGGAVVLLVVALVAVLAGLQSPDRVLWTGQQVVGAEQGGIVTYRWDGQSYSLDAPGYGSSKAVSVYLNPGDPSQAMIDNVFDRVVVALFVLGPAAGAVALLVIGGTRNYRWFRRKLKLAREFRL
jgi:hypothetical protein